MEDHGILTRVLNHPSQLVVSDSSLNVHKSQEKSDGEGTGEGSLSTKP